MSNQLQKISKNNNNSNSYEPIARIAEATVISETLSFCFERKYLHEIAVAQSGFNLEKVSSSEGKKDPIWIKISQVGRPVKDCAEQCFTAIQKVLTSCFVPHQMQLLFIVNSIGGVASLFLGIRPLSSIDVNGFSDSLCAFIQGLWPGVQCDDAKSNEMNHLSGKILGKDGQRKYRRTIALTGIPSMESQYKELYPATIDKLIAGMHGRDFTYIVVADPIDEKNVDKMLYVCRDFNGKAESLKTFNVSDGKSNTLSKSIADSTNWSHAVSNSTTKSGKDWSGAWNKIKGSAGVGLAVGGVATAAMLAFPPAGAAMASIAAAVDAQVAISVGSMLLGLMDTKSETKSVTDTQGGGRTISDTMSATESQTISHNVVNKHIEAVGEHLFYHSKRLETGKAIGCWKVGAYLLGEDESDATNASLQLKSILSGQESIFEPIRIHDITGILPPKELARMEVPTIRIMDSGAVFDHPLGEHHNELKTVLTTKELSYLINFPLRSVPGISVVDSSQEFNLNAQQIDGDNGIEFGKLLYGGSETSMPYHIPTIVLSRHILLSGINGSGKTNTVQAILNNIGELPFLVIEPAKTEYVDWALEHNKKHPDSPIDIYIPGCKKYKGNFVPKPLKLNPFEIVWLEKDQEPNVLTHIDRLKSVFASAFPMYDILPVLMEDLIYTVYQNKSTNWLGEEPQYGVTKAPTLNSMSVCVDQVIEHRQYEDKVQRNMKACLNTRIDSLKRGWKGEMLNTIKSTPWDELFNRRVLINLSYVGDDTDKAFFMALVLQFLYEYRTAAAELGRVDFNDNSCKHLTIIEEAHRVMSKCENQELPQYKSAMMFSNMLSEIRAYGEGLMLVDQVPTRLIPDAIKNTNLKITHRLVAEDDCKEIGQSMGLNEEQRKVIPKLLTGQCVISSSLETNAYWVKADKVK